MLATNYRGTSWLPFIGTGPTNHRPSLATLRRRLETRAGPIQVAPPPPGVPLARWCTALHEAGHAVLAVAIGGLVYELNVYTDRDGSARCSFRANNSDVERLAQLRAGGLAEHHVGGRAWPGCVSKLDHAQASTELRAHRAPQATLIRADALAMRVIRNEQTTIFALAKRLAHTGHLAGPSLAGLLQNIEPVGGSITN